MQLEKLNRLLDAVRTRPFYRSRLSDLPDAIESLSQLSRIPLLTKDELIGDAAGDAAKVFELPRDQYVRLHQTSGTKGHPMVVLDTASDWQWWLDCWDYVLDAAEVTRNDIAMMAFSFGPFIGFWTANDALVRRGALVVPGGGMSSEQRIQMIQQHQCSVLCCTPTYALHLASVAHQNNIDLSTSAVRRVIVAGEPGGSLATVRTRIEKAWGATVVDHTGASELGAWGFGNADGTGIHVIETEFIAECLRFDPLHPEGLPAGDGEQAELVLTNLGRYGGPVLRYRTGDIVRATRQHDHPCGFLFLEGGVLGRADDMLVIRGVNVFPSSIEAMVREIDGGAEFRIIVSTIDEMDQLEIEVEMDDAAAKRLAELMRSRLSLRVPIKPVPPHSLPRFEAKARRLVDRRHQQLGK